MAPDGNQQLSCWGSPAADVVARLTDSAGCGLTMADHFDGGLQLRPLPVGVDVVQAIRLGDGPAFPPFHPSVSLVHGLGVVVGHPVSRAAAKRTTGVSTSSEKVPTNWPAIMMLL